MLVPIHRYQPTYKILNGVQHGGKPSILYNDVYIIALVRQVGMLYLPGFCTDDTAVSTV